MQAKALVLILFSFVLIFFSQIVGLTLVVIPAGAKLSAVFTSWPIVGGAIACGVFLMLMALAGIYGAVKHHQIILFFVSNETIMRIATHETIAKKSMLVCAKTLAIRDFLHGDTVCYFLSPIRGQTFDLNLCMVLRGP